MKVELNLAWEGGKHEITATGKNRVYTLRVRHGFAEDITIKLLRADMLRVADAIYEAMGIERPAADAPPQAMEGGF
ncbi:MAG: hypothetical protein LC793_16260 [Thermomicrobia bacterium]|nr:hypothetical protein [Thermomicrobia bacterium]MCA1723030.1 hypothetical protein [Thermomicrobia bacterium]